jgi:outer membrane protein assembly factor BamB
MELIWTLDIDDKAYFSSNHKCMPIVWKEKLFYAFETVDKTKIDKETNSYEKKIVILEIDIITKDVHRRELYLSKKQSEKRTNTKEWQFTIEENDLILFIGLKLNLSKSPIKISENNSNQEDFLIKSQYNFTDIYINYNHRSTIECFSKNHNKLLWKQNIKAYLYTDITIKDNLIFFGTAGKGGAFYTIDIDTGKVLLEFNNGDGSEFSWSNENILLKDKKGNLVKLNPRTGKIVNVLKLKEKIHFNCPILVNGNKIFTRVYNTKQEVPKLIYVEDL